MLVIPYASPPYLPPEYTEPPDGCPICQARDAMDAGFETHGGEYEQYCAWIDQQYFVGGPELNRLLRQYSRAFSHVVAASRMYNANLFTIYYGLEAPKLLGKVPPAAVLAYQGFRSNVFQHLESMDLAFEKLAQESQSIELTQAPFARLSDSHVQLRAKIDKFWPLVNGYTDERRAAKVGVL